MEPQPFRECFAAVKIHIALEVQLGRSMLGSADLFFIISARGISLSVATRSGLQASPPRGLLVWHALRRVLLRLLWQVLGMVFFSLGAVSLTDLPPSLMCEWVCAVGRVKSAHLGHKALAIAFIVSCAEQQHFSS